MTRISRLLKSDAVTMTEPVHNVDTESTKPLGQARRGFRGRIDAIRVCHVTSLTPIEMENRLIELGFVEGALVEVLHEGAFGRDPIAVRVNDATIALRRSEAMSILVS